MAADLTRHLTEKDRYGGKSPLEQAVSVELQELTKKIAHQIVAEHPDLNQRIREMIRQVIGAALREDQTLQDAVIRAVSEALAVRARQARLAAEDDR